MILKILYSIVATTIWTGIFHYVWTHNIDFPDWIKKLYPAKSEQTKDSIPLEIKEQTNEDEKQTIKSKFEEADENFSHITIEQVFETIKNKGIAEAQRNDFLRKNKDKTVIWTGVVASVTQQWDEDDSDLLVLIYPVNGDKFDLADLTFPYKSKETIIELNKNDKITLKGKFDYSLSAVKPTISLEECILHCIEKQLSGIA